MWALRSVFGVVVGRSGWRWCSCWSWPLAGARSRGFALGRGRWQVRAALASGFWWRSRAGARGRARVSDFFLAGAAGAGFGFRLFVVQVRLVPAVDSGQVIQTVDWQCLRSADCSLAGAARACLVFWPGCLQERFVLASVFRLFSGRCGFGWLVFSGYSPAGAALAGVSSCGSQSRGSTATRKARTASKQAAPR